MSEDLVGRLRAAGCVFAEDEVDALRMAAGSPTELEGMVRRRVAGEPLEVVVGYADFCGVRVQVDPGVFVPRARTGLMVQVAVGHLTSGPTGRQPVVVDLCCGTGAVGLAVATVVADVDLVASDVDPAAVACARRNVEPGGGMVVEGDLDEALPHGLRGRVDVMTCNAPYVPSDAIASMPPEARDHEPRVALDGGADGLAVVRRVVAVASDWLAPGGMVVVEVGAGQVDAACEAVVAAGLRAAVVTDDERGAIVVSGTRSG